MDKKVNETYNLKDEIKEQTSLILQEAMNQETGLLIPHNACVGLKDDPTFKYARFVEDEKYIHIFLHDEEDRYMSELFKKDEKEFRYWLVNRRQMFDKEENLIENYNRIYLKLACCIRDWKVLIERDTTMNYVGSRIPPGVKSDKKRQIWIPRVKYKRRDGLQQRKRKRCSFRNLENLVENVELIGENYQKVCNPLRLNWLWLRHQEYIYLKVIHL